MELFEALYTTRAMRRVRPDPIPDEIVDSMLDTAIRAPSGGNVQNWRFVVVTDPGLRDQIAPLYAEAFETLQQTIYKRSWARAHETGDEAALRLMRSSAWLAENFATVPMWLFVFSRNDPSGASIYPAVWSAMLAARSHGVGTCITTILGVFKSAEVFKLLDVPTDKGWVLNASVSCGYPLGRWDLAGREPVHEVSYADTWGNPLGRMIPQPLWEG